MKLYIGNFQPTTSLLFSTIILTELVELFFFSAALVRLVGTRRENRGKARAKAHSELEVRRSSARKRTKSRKKVITRFS